MHAWGRGLSNFGRLLGVVVFVLVLAACRTANAQNSTTAEPPGANLEVSLLTFGPGEEVWERFGHNAIQVRDTARGAAVLYNYGIFDFADQNFFLNFARGLMTYRVAAGDPVEELPMYVAEGRWIVEQRLNLAPEQRAKLAGFLAWNVRPEHAQYRYDYFRANCSTRVRDALDAAVGGAIKAQTIAPSRGFTYRMDADRLMQPDLPVMLAMDAGLGPYADQRLSYWDESFVPMEFMRHMRDVRVRGDDGSEQPLVAVETLLAAARLPDPPAAPAYWMWRVLAGGGVAGLGLIALAYWRRQAWARVLSGLTASVLSLVLGIGGLVLIGLWALTDHVSAWRNENVLLFNPLCLLLLPCWFGALRLNWHPSRFAMRTGFAIALCAGLAFFVKVFPAFPQDNRFWIALLLPIHLALAIVLTMHRRSTGA
jgi:hypothetical protein